MKKRLKLPTILGLFVLVLGLVVGLILINKSQQFKISADIEAVPKNVRITNISPSSITVSWTTDIESIGFVKWGNENSSIKNISSDEDQEKSFVHHIAITDLDEEIAVFFKINSNGKDYDNNNIPWQTKTKPLFNTDGQTATTSSGTILEVDGQTPSKSIVYMTINGVVVSGLTSDEGSFVISVSDYIQNIDPDSLIEISVISGGQQTAQAVIYGQFVRSVPTIIIGKTYDFRSLTQTDSMTIPQSSLNLPESIEKSSRFEVTRTEQNTQQQTITIDSIEEGEIINTTDPEFFGTAPKNLGVEIQVESELQTGVVSTGSNGKWKWSPPKDLEPGEHKVTIKSKDASGVLRTLTRTFIVQASEGPAFESTPSATPLVTTKPTATATAASSATPSNVPTVTPKSTIEPTPETGSLTPTVGLFIMGVGTLLSSIFIYKKQDA